MEPQTGQTAARRHLRPIAGGRGVAPAFLPGTVTPSPLPIRPPSRRSRNMIQKARAQATAVLRSGSGLYREMAVSALSLLGRRS